MPADAVGRAVGRDEPSEGERMTPAPERPDLRTRIEALHPDGEPCVCVAAVLEMLDEVGPVGGAHWDSNGPAAPVTDAGLREALQGMPLEDGRSTQRIANTVTPDVDVLAHVLTTLDPDTGQDDWQLIHVSQGDDYAKSRREWAHAIAAEYAALSRQAEKETA
jgi:hypothetical protein